MSRIKQLVKEIFIIFYPSKFSSQLKIIFVSKELKNSIKNHKVIDEHLQKNQNGSLKQSDHAQVVCEIDF